MKKRLKFEVVATTLDPFSFEAIHGVRITDQQFTGDNFGTIGFAFSITVNDEKYWLRSASYPANRLKEENSVYVRGDVYVNDLQNLRFNDFELEILYKLVDAYNNYEFDFIQTYDVLFIIASNILVKYELMYNIASDRIHKTAQLLLDANPGCTVTTRILNEEATVYKYETTKTLIVDSK